MMKHLLGLLLYAGVGLTGLFVHSADAASCTKGTNCYADRVNGGDLNDTSLLFVEDFDAPTLYSNTGFGNGSPLYGPFYDATGQSGNRGVNSYWNRKYGNGVSSFTLNSGEPASPTLGSTCGFATCSGAKVWQASNLWSTNSLNPQLAFYTQSSDFSAENGALTAPTNAAGGASGIFQGNSSLVYRIDAGRTHGIAGSASFTASTEVGMTMAIAYASNSESAGIWGPTGGPNASWKHNEWLTVSGNSGCSFDGLFVFYNQQTRSSRPFAGFLGAFGANCGNPGYGMTGGTGGAYCAAVVATLGTAQCNGDASAIEYKPDATLYSQSRDFPDGTWGCVRGYLTGLGTTTSRYRVWFTPTAGPNVGTELLITDFTFNSDSGSNLDARGGYRGLKWNAYANTNQGGGYTASTALTFRYEDNIHIRAGSPVSCAQIGFGTGGGGAITPSNQRLAPASKLRVVKAPKTLHLTGGSK